VFRVDDPGTVPAAVQACHHQQKDPTMEKLSAMMKQLQAMLRNVIRKA
jgi:hypothetical protein